MVTERLEKGGSWAVASCRLTSSLHPISTWKGVLVRPNTVGLLPEIGHPRINSGHHQNWQDAADLGSSVLIPRSSQHDVTRPLEDAGPSVRTRV